MVEPPGNIFEIKDARRWVLEHFWHNIQQLYEPGFLTVTLEIQRKSHLSYGIPVTKIVYAYIQFEMLTTMLMHDVDASAVNIAPEPVTPLAPRAVRNWNFVTQKLEQFFKCI